MKKTVTANISGLVFHIDEDAYEKLNQYLARVRERLSTEEGKDEILADIESRIAEMFQSKLNNFKKVIAISDVKEVIDQLGEPEQFEDAGESSQANSHSSYRNEKNEKRLYRDPDDKYIAGVAGGLGAFFNIDPTWIRVAFVVFVFVYGFGPLLYLILWIVVPKARTTAERLEMRGEKINLSNIEKTIKEEINDLKTNFKEFSEEAKEHFKKKDKSKPPRESRARVASDIINVFAKAVGIVLIIIAFSLIVAIISGIYMIPVGFQHEYPDWMVSIPEIISAFLASDIWLKPTLIALLVLVGIPILGLLMAGVQLLFDIRTSGKFFGAISLIIWLAALATVALAAISSARNFTADNSTSNLVEFSQSSWPNLYINLDESKIASLNRIEGKNQITTWHSLWNVSDAQATGQPQLLIKRSESDQVTLEIVKESYGITPVRALQNASEINYSFVQKDSLLVLDPFFTFDKIAGWRNQKVLIVLGLPENKIGVVSKSLKRNLTVRWNNEVNILTISRRIGSPVRLSSWIRTSICSTLRQLH